MEKNIGNYVITYSSYFTSVKISIVCWGIILSLHSQKTKASGLSVRHQITNQDTIKAQDTAKQDAVKGRVTDSKKAPLAGVTIEVKGTDVLVQSDEEGAFEIKTSADSSSMLVFSLLGFETFEMPMNLANGQTIELTEAAAEALDEVVVIGYGTVQKKNLTGAVSTLKGADFQNNAITNTEEGIAGKIAGVRVSQPSGLPGSAMNVKIRGINSITASSSPLYVVDGIPQDHMRNINPRDIASMEVLKDASSAAIYGARGGNGVIVITTRSGAEGKTQIDFDAYTGFQKVDNVLPMMNTEDYTAYIMYVRNERFRLTGGDLSQPITSRPAEFQYPESYLTPGSLPNNNWQDIIYRRAMMQNYNLNVSGGGEIGSYVVSGGYLRQDGVMHHTGFERYNLRANTLFNIGEALKIGANLALSATRQNNPNTEGKESNAHYAIVMPPVVGIDQNTEATGYSQAQTFINPLVRLEEMTAAGKGTNIQLNTFADYTPIPELTLRSQLGYNSHNATYNEFIPFNVNKGAQATGFATNRNTYHFSIQNTANYVPDLGDSHFLDVLLGQSFERFREEYMAAGGDGYPNDLIPSLNNAGNPTLATTSIGVNAITSFFGRIQYHFLDKYLLSLAARYDGSSRFGPNNKWGLFPSLSVGWKINEENFLSDVEWMSLLKIRASIGMAGNDRIGNYEHISLLAGQNYNLNGKLVNGLVPSNIPNPNLSWETTISRDIGLDVFLFEDRIQFTADMYFNRTRDLLLRVPVTRLSGFSTIRRNIGEMQNNGWELQLTTQNINNESLRWNTSFNFSQNRNKVLSMGPDNAPIIINSWNGDAFVTRVGHPVGSYYMYRTQGLLTASDFDADGNPLVPTLDGQLAGNLRAVDVNGDGIINTDDQAAVGSFQPDFLWGISSKLSFKGFDFSFDLQGQQGGEIFYQGRRGFDNGVGDGTNQYSRWRYSYKSPESMASIPAGRDMTWDGETPNFFGVNPFYNDTWVYDASFVRIRNITLGYNLPSSLLERLKISNARIYVMGDNVYTFTDYPGANPEANNEGNESTAAGVDYGAYPLSRRYTLGINVVF
ncbi:SusC/RagA family TonB-linked outer membrane protein [Parapedobacter tibetensis]|uniref:SusC/RagA family TonB-linked outer membrane protein n=1 Tax=Parapedobacter tibetensis TaxID=2972951 RepID=UPI00214DEEBD|nr:TonB-dependent receptor [Parapedobacter tibetensis]